ncbi:hypothetical protein tinsulaeT_23830 [Thalassotalea insulae]|uniref:Uncharacterized protein n=1 Tax=Thalassotalea insulae TaxID=2056778 RepID=A0ABQ6GSW5_9GAMM|nr:hypothetical protein [Thalassotalea insulae]GLX79043.1 hypothetical protein tinsulaeT_23830 [Thalassotalea insulae]
MKKTKLSLATATTIFTLLYTQPATATGTTDVGVKLAEKVASLLIGEAFSSIFGGDDPAATPEQVQNIVDAGFNKAALNEVQVEIGSVMSSIDTYNYTLDYKYNGQIVNDIVSQTGTVQTQVGVHMNHDNFVSLIKTYMSASTVRLAFLSERRRYVQLEGQEEIDNLSAADAASKGQQMAADLAANIQGENAVIAGAALESVSDLANFFYEDFYEKGPGTQGCIYKYPESPWSFPDGRLASNIDGAGKDRSTVTCRNYAKLIPQGTTFIEYMGTAGAITASKYGWPMNIFGTTPWQTTDVMPIHKDDLWAFSIKKWQNNPGPHQFDYHMMVVKGEDLARYVRNLNSISKYPVLFGDVESQAITWIDIIASNGNSDQLSSALKKATELGVEHSKLTSRYKAKHPAVVAAFEQWYQSKLSTWGLSSDHAPTRISFNSAVFYPTDAPAWLADAMN